MASIISDNITVAGGTAARLLFKKSCSVVDSDGFEYQEFTCLYPELRPLYLDAEISFDPSTTMRWMSHHWGFAFGTVTLYVALVFWGQRYMTDRKPWSWRPQLAAWNLLLSFFSTWGFARCLPHLAHNFASMSLRDNFCVPARTTVGGGSTGLWIFLFTISKFPELLDTFFLVVHKKKVLFLHWYHHVTVLLYCWHCYTTASIPGIIFVTMNLGVHSLMYAYYFLMAMRCKPSWFNPMVITVLQVSQMFVGVAITLVGFYYLKHDSTCAIGAENTHAGCLLYGSYLVLFLQFFVGRYLNKPKVKKM